MKPTDATQNELKIPNDATLHAMRELEAGDGIRVGTMDDYRRVAYGDDTVNSAKGDKMEQDRQYNIHDDFEWFRAHQDELVKTYNGKFLAIRGGCIKGVADTAHELKLKVPLPIGRYLIQRCVPGRRAYTVKIHTPGLVRV